MKYLSSFFRTITSYVEMEEQLYFEKNKPIERVASVGYENKLQKIQSDINRARLYRYIFQIECPNTISFVIIFFLEKC